MITIIGPTASGKTRLACCIANRLGSEIISADSRQVYRGMDIGTGKDLSDYFVHGRIIPHHLIDILPAGARYNLFAFQQDFHRVYTDILARGIEEPVFCGGTGLYAEAVLRGYRLPDVPANPALRKRLEALSVAELSDRLAGYGSQHNTTDSESPQRTIRAIEIAEHIREQEAQGIRYGNLPPVPSLIFALFLEPETRRQRITVRLKQRLEEGLADEIRGLIASGVAAEDLIYYGLEYKYVTLFVLGRMSYDAMFTKLETEIHRFAKRQMTWFRGMERRGLSIQWLDASLSPEENAAAILDRIGK